MTPSASEPTTSIKTVGGVLSPVLAQTASSLERCDAELATAFHAILYDLLPLDDALLYYRDWFWERKFILAESTGTEPPTLFTGRHAPAACHSATSLPDQAGDSL